MILWGLTIPGGRGVVKHLYNVDTWAKRCASPDANPDQVRIIFGDLYTPGGHSHTHCVLLERIVKAHVHAEKGVVAI